MRYQLGPSPPPDLRDRSVRCLQMQLISIETYPRFRLTLFVFQPERHGMTVAGVVETPITVHG